MYLLCIASPFLGSALAGLAGRWLGGRGSGCVTVFGLFRSFFRSLVLWFEVCVKGCSVWIPLGTWFSVSTLNVSWGFYFDPLAVCMISTVTFVSSLVHLYSLGYMTLDPHLPRFMSYLSLFTGFMLILVTAPNALSLLVGWEGIGVCSYLRIGFWYHRLSATKSAIKAMLVNRVSDTARLIGVVLMWWYAGSVDFAVLLSTTSEAYYVDWICFCLLFGAAGKSAQIGLHIWLADAMEGKMQMLAKLNVGMELNQFRLRSLLVHRQLFVNQTTGIFVQKTLLYGVFHRHYVRYTKQELSDFQKTIVTPYQKEAINGLLLSDGSISLDSRLAHTFKDPHLDFIRWVKFEVLGTLSTQTEPTPHNAKKETQDTPTQHWIATRKYPYFGELRAKWYFERSSALCTQTNKMGVALDTQTLQAKLSKKYVKIVPNDFQFTAISLAFMIIGDAYWENDSKTVIICTENFTIDEVEL